MALDPKKFDLVLETMLHQKMGVQKALEFHKVDPHAFFDLMLEDHISAQKYTRTQQARAEILADEIIDISDTELDAQRARNRIDSRKWYASKLQPQKYGDRIDLNVTQTVDLSAALAEAKRRALPLRDSSNTVDVEYTDIKPKQLPSATGNESVGETKAVESESPALDLSEDIFS